MGNRHPKHLENLLAPCPERFKNTAIFSSSETFLEEDHEWFKSYYLLPAFYAFLKTITFNQYIKNNRSNNFALELELPR